MLAPSPAQREFGEPVRALVDTCVMLDALGIYTTENVFRARAVFHYLATQGQLVHSDDTLREWTHIAKRPHTKRHLNRKGGRDHVRTTMRYLTSIKRGLEKINPTEVFNLCRDRADNMWLELAAAGRAHVIITRDNDLLVLGHHKTCRILTPLDFLEQIAGCRPLTLSGIPVRGAGPSWT